MPTLIETVPQIDWDNQAIEFLPVSHRTPRFIAWFTGMVNGSNCWLNQNFWNYCYGDEFSLLWDYTLTYGLNDIVITYFGVYISTVNNNLNNNPEVIPPYSSLSTYDIGYQVTFGTRVVDGITYPNIYICNTTISSPESFTSSKWTLLTGSVWYKIAPSYIGARERAQYNSQKMVMEKALNRTFLTTYRDPTSIVSGGYLPLSDIYITTTAIVDVTFGVCTVAQDLGNICTVALISGVCTTVISATDTTYQFVVHVPTSLSVALGVAYYEIISSFVSKWSLLGTTFSIVLY